MAVAGTVTLARARPYSGSIRSVIGYELSSSSSWSKIVVVAVRFTLLGFVGEASGSVRLDGADGNTSQRKKNTHRSVGTPSGLALVNVTHISSLAEF